MNEIENQQTHRESEKNGSPLFGVGLALFFAAAAFFSGLEIGSHTSTVAPANNEAFLGGFFSPAPKETVEMGEFWRVWDLLDSKFVASTSSEPVSDTDKIENAIAGLVKSYGDPYTVYMPPADAAIFEGDIAGNFSGVGMEIGIRNDVLTVIAPLPETPAEKAGIRAGDMVIKIDEESTEGMAVDEAVKKIRGEKGSSVSFTIFREGVTEPLVIPVVRDVINVPSSKVEERDGVYIIRLYSFSAVSEADIQQALRSFMQSGKTKLIIDLRGNPGGYLQSAVNIASYFLPMGKVVVRENYGEGVSEDLYRSQGRDLHQYRDFETVVLIDGGSASASEILAGALKEHGVATLMGDTSFGKGSVQELVEMESGASLKVTIARWLTPNGHSISENGLEPDIKVEVTDEDRLAERDPQMDAAIKHLNE